MFPAHRKISLNLQGTTKLWLFVLRISLGLLCKGLWTKSVQTTSFVCIFLLPDLCVKAKAESYL